MRLSNLQKFILKKCYNSKSFRVSRNKFLEFYNESGKAKKELQVKIVTGSIENLIDNELLIGFGMKTKCKWFIQTVALTGKGVRATQKLIGKQLKLKLK